MTREERILDQGWQDTKKLVEWQWKCGYCNSRVGNNIGYGGKDGQADKIYICPGCGKPTVFVKNPAGIGHRQVPGALPGVRIEGLYQNVGQLHDEIKLSMSVGAFTAATLALRTLLMHIAVDQGAPEGKSFAEYVTYMEAEHLFPPKCKEWVDKIRLQGNKANHQICIASKEDTEELLMFAEALLKFLYEFPARIQSEEDEGTKRLP